MLRLLKRRPHPLRHVCVVMYLWILPFRSIVVVVLHRLIVRLLVHRLIVLLFAHRLIVRLFVHVKF